VLVVELDVVATDLPSEDGADTDASPFAELELKGDWKNRFLGARVIESCLPISIIMGPYSLLFSRMSTAVCVIYLLPRVHAQGVKQSVCLSVVVVVVVVVSTKTTRSGDISTWPSCTVDQTIRSGKKLVWFSL
jgi:hypothetical protein